MIQPSPMGCCDDDEHSRVMIVSTSAVSWECMSLVVAAAAVEAAAEAADGSSRLKHGSSVWVSISSLELGYLSDGFHTANNLTKKM